MGAHVALRPGMESVLAEFMAVALEKNRAEAGTISFTLFRLPFAVSTTT